MPMSRSAKRRAQRKANATHKHEVSLPKPRSLEEVNTIIETNKAVVLQITAEWLNDSSRIRELGTST